MYTDVKTSSRPHCCIVFLQFSYSRCYNQPADGHICIAELCSCCYMYDRRCVPFLYICLFEHDADVLSKRYGCHSIPTCIPKGTRFWVLADTSTSPSPFAVCSGPARQMLRLYLKWGKEHFLPHSLLIVIRPSVDHAQKAMIT